MDQEILCVMACRQLCVLCVLPWVQRCNHFRQAWKYSTAQPFRDWPGKDRPRVACSLRIMKAGEQIL